MIGRMMKYLVYFCTILWILNYNRPVYFACQHGQRQEVSRVIKYQSSMTCIGIMAQRYLYNIQYMMAYSSTWLICDDAMIAKQHSILHTYFIQIPSPDWRVVGPLNSSIWQRHLHHILTYNINDMDYCSFSYVLT